MLAVAAFLLRTAGVALLGAWALDNLLRRQGRRAAFAAAVALVTVGGWLAYVASLKHDAAYVHPAYPYQRAPYQFYNVSYIDNLLYVDPFAPELGRVTLRTFAERVGSNLALLPEMVSNILSADRQYWVTRLETRENDGLGYRLISWTAKLALHLFGVLPFIGLLILMLRGEWLVPLYVGASLALIVVTPWPGQFIRYLSPVAPFLVLGGCIALVYGTEIAARLYPKARDSAMRWVPAYAVLAAMLVVQVVGLGNVLRDRLSAVRYRGRDGRAVSYRMFFYDRQWRGHDEAIDWLATHADSGDIVVTDTPHWVYLRTGLKAVMPPFESDPARAEALVDSVPARYVILDSLGFVDVSRRYTAWMYPGATPPPWWPDTRIAGPACLPPAGPARPSIAGPHPSQRAIRRGIRPPA